MTVVVDNGSDLGSFGRLIEPHEWPEYVRNETNEGFTGGKNAGIERTLEFDPDCILLLNNDTVVQETVDPDRTITIGVPDPDRCDSAV